MINIETVIVDNREQSRIKKIKNFYDNPKNKINGERVNVEVKKLPIGDYIYKDTVIEFKEASDFIGSVKDHRVFRQAINMKQNYKYHYIIIKGDLFKAVKKTYYMKFRFTMSQCLGSMASLSQITHILQVNTNSQAFHLMTYLFSKNYDCKDRSIPQLEVNTDNTVVNYLSCIPSVNIKRAKNIVGELHLRNLHDLLNVDREKLLSVDGVGNKTADTLLSWIK